MLVVTGKAHIRSTLLLVQAGVLITFFIHLFSLREQTEDVSCFLSKCLIVFLPGPEPRYSWYFSIRYLSVELQ